MDALVWAGFRTPGYQDAVSSLCLLLDGQSSRPSEMAIPKFEVAGGLVSGTEESRGIISLDRPNRQWDYPFGKYPSFHIDYL